METPELGRQARSYSLLLMAMVLALLAGCATQSGLKSSSRSGGYTSRHIVIDSAKRNDVALTAMGLLGTRYRYGGSSPNTGFDCSGLIQYVFENVANAQLPHNTAEIAQVSRPVPRSKLSVGDFVFFNTLNSPYSHMGIYIGDGQFVNAPSTGGHVRIDALSSSYFAKRYEGARTLF
ncbi:MAG: peptidoglycan endopeptidase [Candidimonas sp.]|nr:MAG: peptidoglycan endopeptidase [Candidimonas sp.]TAM75317.1 MAG: peptidoglycan endopeptidase [Candidimonas sp.]